MSTDKSGFWSGVSTFLIMIPGVAAAVRAIIGTKQVLPGDYSCRTRDKNGTVRCRTCGGSWLLTESKNPWPEICPNKPKEDGKS